VGVAEVQVARPSTVMWWNKAPAGMSMHLATSARWSPTSWAPSSRPLVIAGDAHMQRVGAGVVGLVVELD
jgi:hypothetical protein